MALAQCMVHQIPPRNFTLPCMLLNKTVLSPFSAEVVESWSGWRIEHGAPETKPAVLMNEESFLCCLWSDNNIDCSLYRASMQARKFIPSEISISASQEIGRFSIQRHKKLLLQNMVGVFCCLRGVGLYQWVFIFIQSRKISMVKSLFTEFFTGRCGKLCSTVSTGKQKLAVFLEEF